MARYHFKQSPDGTFTIRARLSVGKVTMYTNQVTGVVAQDLQKEATKLAAGVQAARLKHSLPGGAPR